MEGPHVFLSHSPQDGAIAQRLVTDLRAAGAGVEAGSAGASQDDTAAMGHIEAALGRCEWLVFVLTPAALTSPAVQLQVNLALQRVRAGLMRAVIPVLAAPATEPGLVPAAWADALQRYDAARDYPAALASLLRTLELRPLALAERASSPAATRAQPPALRPTAEPIVLPPRLTQLGFNGLRIDGVDVIVPPMRSVPAGPFQMGSDANAGEGPVHTVMLPTYAIGTFPVIVAEYACFVHAGHPPPPDGGVTTWPRQLTTLEYPVVNVSWQSAVAYAAWLSERTGQRWRVATEAEWEKAARWDAATGMAREYPWGDGFDPIRCNTRESGQGSATPVGTYPNGVSPCGAQDMAGNIREWTSSLHVAYPYQAGDGRERLDAPGERVLRGGSWFNFAEDARAAYRDGRPPEDFTPAIGFRLALDLPAGA
jgi:formylglycine-generating enzyme required for sulfatase activity